MLNVVLIGTILAAGGGLFPRAHVLPWQGVTQEVNGALADLIGRYHELGEFNGSVLVARQGQILVNKGFGHADMGEKIANGPETRFLIGSLTKQFTAVVILKLIEAGRLSLDSSLADALPYYRMDTGTKVRIRHLLDHTSGIPCFTRVMREVRVCPTTREFIQKFCSQDLDSEPGALFRYNNGGYVILGAVIEQVTGLSYEEALRQTILSPLGMNASGLGREGLSLPHMAAGYQRRGGQVVAAGPVDPYLAFSAGGMYSTTTDIARWEKAFYEDAVLSPRGRAFLHAAPANDYFCGQRFKRQAVGPGRTEREVIFHGGRILGFNSLLLRIPQDRIFIVLFNNTDSTRLETMAAGLLDILHGRVPRQPRRSLAEELRAAQKGLGMAAALRDLRVLRREEGALKDPEPEEIQLTAFGYELLGEKKQRDALAVLSFLTEQFPNSWNAYDSLAEAQAAAGLHEQAIRNYEKSLELNPANRNANEQIQKLKKACSADL
jgi:CubicO group peptidase (beta-lactamase class C family)